MKKEREKITRRGFLQGAAGVALAGSMCALPLDRETEESTSIPAPAPRAKVVLVRDEGALTPHGKPDAQILQRMLDDAVTTLLEEPDPMAAWRSLVKPSDTVGIKSNIWRFLRTPPELEEAIRRRVMDAGVPAGRIGIDDRGLLHNPIFLEATALVNVRPMRTHHWSGVGSLIKNYIMFVKDPESWHGDSCADLAGLWKLPLVKDKTRLNVLVMLTPHFHSKGPHAYNSKYIWPYKGLLVGTDPVATDATGLRILQARRRDFFGKDLPFEVPPKHIEVAERKFGLGVADPARIDLKKLGWAEGALI
jgi:hypothetical protein